MLIGIDGNEANVVQRVGIGRYAYELLLHLYRIKDKELKFLIYLKERPVSGMPPETSCWRYKVFRPKKLWTQVALPICLSFGKEKPNVFFTPSHYAPRFSPCPSVISIMDLSFVFFPEMFTKKDLFQLKNWTSYSVRRASKIITISNFSKKAIIDYYKIPEDKIVVTYPGYDSSKYQISNIKDQKYILNIKKKYEINGDYILFVGTIQPRKNIERLIEAFKELKTQNSKLKSLKLVIVGKKGWLFKNLFKKIKELKLEKKVIFTDYIPEEELPFFYRGAKCLVNPSLYEGFGLPVIEAMACGCPVIVSNVSSLPEIVGEVGILVNPYNVGDIVNGIIKMLHFDTIKYRSRVEEGLEQVKKFSWEKCAEETLEILKEVAFV